jgi:hypothetical protein
VVHLPKSVGSARVDAAERNEPVRRALDQLRIALRVSGCPGVRVREARAVEVHEHLRGQDRHVVVALDEHSLEVPVRVDLSEGFLVVHRPLRLVHRVEPCLERVKVSMKASPYLFLQSSALASQKPVWASMTNRPSFTGPPWAKPAMRTLPRPARERKRCGGPARAIVNEPGQAGCAGRRAATAAASTPGSRPRRAGAPPLGPDRARRRLGRSAPGSPTTRTPRIPGRRRPPTAGRARPPAPAAGAAAA